MAGEERLERVYERVSAFLQGAREYLGLDQRLESSKQFATDHPLITLFILVMTAMCSVPIFCFMAFAFGSMMLAFAGFVFLEGTVLTVASILLGGILFLVSLFSVGFSIFIVLAFYLVSFGHSMLQAAVSKYNGVVSSPRGIWRSNEVTSSVQDIDPNSLGDGNGAAKT